MISRKMTKGTVCPFILLLLLVGDASAFQSPTTNILRHHSFFQFVLMKTKTNPSYFQLQKKSIEDTKATTTSSTTTLEQLKGEYAKLKALLRRDMLQLKHHQAIVAEEEELLLTQQMDETEMEIQVQEATVLAAEKEYQKAHEEVEQSKALEHQANQNFEWVIGLTAAMNQWKNKFVDSEMELLLQQTASDVKASQDYLKISHESEQEALKKEAQAEDLLQFLEAKEALLKQILHDPELLQEWTEEELFIHHENMLQAASLEWEYKKMRYLLCKDLLQLKHQQVVVAKEEAALVSKAAEIVTAKLHQQEDKVQEAVEKMKCAHEQVKEAVAIREQAYQDTLWAIDQAGLLFSSRKSSSVNNDYDENDDDYQRRGVEFWVLAQAAEDLKGTDEAVQEARARRTEEVMEEIQAEDLLHMLQEKETILKDLRTPGNEEALQKWIQYELSNHKSLMDVIKGQELVATTNDPTIEENERNVTP